jgi:hypothetical protein
MSNHDLNQDPELEKLIQAICWKLYRENDHDSHELKKEWEKFANATSNQDKINKITKALAKIWEQVFAIRFNSQLQNSVEPAIKKIENIWIDWFGLLSGKNQEINKDLIEQMKIDSQELKTSIKNAIRQVLIEKSPQLPNLASPQTNVNPQPNSDITASQSSTGQFLETSVSRSTQDLRQSSNNLSTDHENPANRVSENSDATEIGNTTKKTDSQIDETSQNHAVPQHPTAGLADFPNQEVPSSEGTQQQLAQTEAIPNPVIPPWQYHPVPGKDTEPEPHSEFDYKSDQSPEGLKLIGARVRGKMHKHQGTNCDDWFEFSTCGQWTIIAVADGAGSKKFSRIGAKVSCKKAVESLHNSLIPYELEKQVKQKDLENNLKQDEDWMFIGKDIKYVQESLYKALNGAYNEVEKIAGDLKNYRSYTKAVGKKELDIKDLSSTLLLAVHTTIKVEDSSYDFILTCQVGDGILAAISQENTLQLLGKPDIGEHGGQTDFLTSKSKLSHPNLVQKTFAFLGNLKALMIMTDGVADDYFPNDPGMLELYGDLILNKVINIPNIDSQEIERQLQDTSFKTQDEVRRNQSKFQDEIERILLPDADEPKTVSIRSIAKYAEQLGKSIKEVVASPGLLNAGILAQEMSPECEEMPSEEKLKIWLDSYYRRGSFDDRTLVVLYREEN